MPKKDEVAAEPQVEPEKSKLETVEVKKDVLDKIIEANEANQKKMAEQQSTIDMLMATADKARMAKYQEQNQLPIIRVYKLRTIGDKVVVKWKSLIDEMYQMPNGMFVEKQIVEVTDTDGKTYEMSYLESEKLTKIATKLISRSATTDSKGNEQIIFKLQADDGAVYDINAVYVN